MSDPLLVQRASAGDLTAFDALVRQYQVPVLRLCAGLLGDDHAAQDAAQETFFTAWRSISRFRGDAKFSTWLYRIATNRCLKELRRRPPVSSAPIPDLPATQGVPHEEAEATARLKAVTEAVGHLTPELRAPLLLRELEDLPYKEIAQVLGVSVTTVKTRIYRARIEVARLLVGS